MTPPPSDLATGPARPRPRPLLPAPLRPAPLLPELPVPAPEGDREEDAAGGALLRLRGAVPVRQAAIRDTGERSVAIFEENFLDGEHKIMRLHRNFNWFSLRSIFESWVTLLYSI